MPFTVAHTAVALPFRKSRLAFPALVVGTMAPDFEYFLRMAPQGRFAHTLPGIAVFTLPAGLAALWIYERVVRGVLERLLPGWLPPANEFRFGGLSRFLWICLSMLLGIATHVLWDDFTHSQSWIVANWPLLRTTVELPFPAYRYLALYKVLQHLSTLVGMSALGIYWHRHRVPLGPPGESPRISMLGALAMVAALGGLLHATHYARHAGPSTVLGVFTATTMALFWWELVLLGLLWPRNRTAPAN